MMCVNSPNLSVSIRLMLWPLSRRTDESEDQEIPVAAIAIGEGLGDQREKSEDRCVLHVDGNFEL
jgi:hypothetical protein